MPVPTRALTAFLLCLALPGCYVKTYGVQTTGNGQSSTATATQVGGSAKFAGGRASFSSGQVPPQSAQGAHASFGKGASVVLIAGLVIGDFLNYIAGYAQPKPLPPGTKIMETCSCYRKASDETGVMSTGDEKN